MQVAPYLRPMRSAHGPSTEGHAQVDENHGGSTRDSGPSLVCALAMPVGICSEKFGSWA